MKAIVGPTERAFRSYITNDGKEGSIFSSAAKLGYRAVTQFKFKKKEKAARTVVAELLTEEQLKTTSSTPLTPAKQKSTALKAAKTAANAFLTVIGALAGLVTFVIGTAASPFVLLGSSLARGCEVLQHNIDFAKAKSQAKKRM